MRDRYPNEKVFYAMIGITPLVFLSTADSIELWAYIKKLP